MTEAPRKVTREHVIAWHKANPTFRAGEQAPKWVNDYYDAVAQLRLIRTGELEETIH